MIAQNAPLLIEIRQGNHTRTVPFESLAATLRLSSQTIRVALTRLLFESFDQDERASSPTREPTEGVRNEPHVTNVNVPKDINRKRYRERDVVVSGDSGDSVGGVLTAAFLAEALGDRVHLAAFEKLVAEHPETRLRAALSITLARPDGSIHRNRGAYFTGVLRVLAAREGPPSPFYA